MPLKLGFVAEAPSHGTVFASHAVLVVAVAHMPPRATRPRKATEQVELQPAASRCWVPALPHTSANSVVLSSKHSSKASVFATSKGDADADASAQRLSVVPATFFSLQPAQR